MRKRLFSGILALVMLLSAFPTGALAAQTAEEPAAVETDAAEPPDGSGPDTTEPDADPAEASEPEAVTDAVTEAVTEAVADDSTDEEPAENSVVSFYVSDETTGLPMSVSPSARTLSFSVSIGAETDSLSLGARLWSGGTGGDPEDWSSQYYHLDRCVDSLTNPDTELTYRGQDGSDSYYQVSGTFSLSGLSTGERLYVELYQKDAAVREDPEAAFTSSLYQNPFPGYLIFSVEGGVRVSPVDGIDLSGAVYDKVMVRIPWDEWDQTQGEPYYWYSPAEEGKLFYTAGSGESVHTLTLTGSGLTSADALTVSGAASLVPNSPSVSGPDKNGLYTLTAALTVSAAGGEAVLSYGGGRLLGVEFRRFAAQPKGIYVTSAETVAQDGQSLTVNLSGFNLPANAQAYFAGYEEYEQQYDDDGNWTGSVPAGMTVFFRGTGVTERWGVYTVTLTQEEPLNPDEDYRFVPLYIGGEEGKLLEAYSTYSDEGLDEDAYFNPVYVSLNAGGGGEPPLVNPSVTVPSQTTFLTLTPSITWGSYEGGTLSYRVNGGGWTVLSGDTIALPAETQAGASVALSFRFSKDGLDDYTTEAATVYQNGEVRPAPTDLKLLQSDTREESPRDAAGAWYAYSGQDYILTARYDGPDADTVTLSAALTDSCGGAGAALPMTRNAEGVFETAARSFYGVRSVTVFAPADSAYASDGGRASLSVTDGEAAAVSYAYTPWIPASYVTGGADGNWHYRFIPGDSFDFSFYSDWSNADDRYTGMARLHYRDESGAEQTAEQAAAHNGTAYTGTMPIPADAVNLVSLVYTLDDANGIAGQSKTFDLSRYVAGAELALTGFPAAYEDRYVDLEVRDGDGWTWVRGAYVSDGQALLGDLEGGVTCRYVIDTGAVRITGEPFPLPKSAVTRDVSGEVPDLGTLTVRGAVSGGSESGWISASAELETTWNGQTGTASVYPDPEGAEIPGVPVGASLRLDARMYHNDFQRYEAAFDGGGNTAVMADSLSALLTFYPFALRTVSGTVRNESGNPVAGATVRAVQTLSATDAAGTATWESVRITSTDGGGNWSFPEDRNGLYDGFPADITVIATGYVDGETTVSAAGGDGGNLTLAFRDDLMVIPTLEISGKLVKPDGSTEDYTAEGDTARLQPSAIYRGGRYIPFTQAVLPDGSARYYLPASELDQPAGTEYTVRFNPVSGESYSLHADDSGYYTFTGTLDDSRSLRVTVAASTRGTVSAEVAGTGETDAGEPVVGWLLAFRSYGNWWDLAGRTSGQGVLSITGLSEGQYAFVALKTRSSYVSMAESLISQNALRLLHGTSRWVYDSASSSYRTQYDTAWRDSLVSAGELCVLGADSPVTISDGLLFQPDGLTPAKPMEAAFFGDFDVRHSTEETADGSAVIKMHIAPKPGVEDFGFTAVYVAADQNADQYANGTRMIEPVMGGSSSQGWHVYYNYSAGESPALLDLYLTDRPADETGKVATAVRFEGRGRNADGQMQSYSGTVILDEELPVLELEVPEQIDLEERDGEAVFEAPVRVRTGSDFRGQTVTIWDNGVAVGTVTADEAVTDVTVPLTQTEGRHELYATVEAAGTASLQAAYAAPSAAPLAASPRSSAFVAGPGSGGIYVSNFNWRHRNDQGWQNWSFSSVNGMAGKTFRYWPSKPSTVTFTLNGVNPGEVTSVRLITYHSEDDESGTAYEAVNVGGNRWQVGGDGNTSFGYFTGFGVEYELDGGEFDQDRWESVIDRGLGLRIPSAVSGSTGFTLSDEALPALFRENKTAFQADPAASSETSTVVRSDLDGWKGTYEASRDTARRYSRNDIEAMKAADASNPDAAWGSWKTREGMVYLREVVTQTPGADGAVSLHMEQSLYMANTAIDAAMAANAGDPSAALAAVLSDAGETAELQALPPADEQFMGLINTTADLETNFSVLQEIANNVSKYDATFLNPSFSRGCLLAGTVVSVYSILKGPGGKDPNKLYALLQGITDQKTYDILWREIRDYERLRSRHYATNTFVTIGTTGSTWMTLAWPYRAATWVGGKVYGIIGGWTDENLSMEFDSILRSILLELAKEARQMKMTLKQKLPGFDFYIDPSGYVFEAVEDNRVSGVTATISRSTDGGQTYSPWTDLNPDADERQANPQTTALADGDPDTAGRYGWMTPVGTWKVGFTDERPNGEYQSAETKDIPVPPEHTQVNIGLLSTKAPAVERVDAGAGKFLLTFSKYLQAESVVDVTERAITDADDQIFPADTSAITVLDADGNVVPGIVSLPDKVRNTGYVEGPYQQDLIDSEWFVKRVLFTPDADLSAGTACTVQAAKSVRSYAGVAMAADYESAAAVSDSPLPDWTVSDAGYTVTLHSNGGTVAESSVRTDGGGRLSALPDAARNGYTFDGWFPSASGGTRVTASTVFDGDTDLYAHWTESAAAPSAYTVTFNPNGGTVSAATALTDAAGRLSSLPTPAWTGSGSYTFAGWFTAASGGTRVTADQVYTADTTLYAHWTANGGSSSGGGSGGGSRGGSSGSSSPSTTAKPAVTINNPSGGTATATADTVTITPADGWRTASVTVNGNTVQVPDSGILTGLKSTDTVSVTFEQIPDSGEEPPQTVNPFRDVSAGSYYYDAVLWAVGSGVTTGRTADTFDPSGICTRAQTVTFLWRASGSPEPSSAVNPFADVPADAYYAKAVLWAAEKGITQGTTASTFSPGATVTRAQTAAFLYRMSGGSAAGTDNPFSDVPESAYYRDSVLWAYEQGITTGTTPTTFNPGGSCLRSHIVTFLYRYFAE